MVRQPIFGIGLTMMVSVIKNLAGAAGLVRGSLLFPCGNIVTNSSWRDQAHSHYICLLLIYKSKLNTYLQKDRRKQQYTKSYRVKAFFPVFQQVDLTFR